jgi:transcription-repair coupling factor (superfamily II helicase)
MVMRSFRGFVQQLGSEVRAQDISLLAAGTPYLLSSLCLSLEAPTLVIEASPEKARRLQVQVATYCGDGKPVYLMPESEVLPFERLAPDANTTNQRLLALAALASSPGTVPPPIVITSIGAALQKTLDFHVFQSACHTLNVGQRLLLTQLLSHWIELGYRREEIVDVPGIFGVRGGIVDIYPPNSSHPYRIDLIGDEIESIRTFDPKTQCSVGCTESITVAPASETLPLLSNNVEVSRLISDLNFAGCTAIAREQMQEELSILFAGQGVEDLLFYNGLLNQGCLLDYLPVDTVIALDGKKELETRALELDDRAHQLRSAREGRGEIPTNFPNPQISLQQFWVRSAARRQLFLTQASGEEDEFSFQSAKSYYGNMDLFAKGIREDISQGRSIIAVSRHSKRVAEILEESDIGVILRDSLEEMPKRGTVTVLPGSLANGWSLPIGDNGVTIFADSELFGTVKEQPLKSRNSPRTVRAVPQLVPGEFVVHVDHGIAKFDGTTEMQANGERQEYLILKYADGDRLYVPTDHLDRVSPYMAAHDKLPPLTRLGTPEWSKTKDKARTATRQMARELLDTYASRQLAGGHAFSQDTAWQRELEDSFPYEDTEDQKRTIAEVKSDMEQYRPMDRLVCGDVGYGKTEMALRAAFKVVEEGMQVALLVPTTVLAQQHYATFAERLAPFPVNVEVLSRFRTPIEQDGVIQRLQLGTVDIVIGTHRLLQKDVTFKNLGLVIVDEEQRFGVTHKERLKQLRREVDLLTLSATPIPRTLYMALSGIRDMSTMETPPEERLPVKTYVSQYSDEVVKEAILREIERGGQVFYLHNRVNTINRVMEHLRHLVPKARIAKGHGKMNERDLEQVMTNFAQGQMDVLVCTTIIESGLDIPNANTLIVDRADRFGLSQLYQLRGRVGRSSNRAYCYLLTPPRRNITESARRRLTAMLEASELGSGFQIAMRDLEIRGAGNILGSEQSGYMHAVGFQLYTKLLNEAVADMGQIGEQACVPNSSKAPPKVTLPLAAHIPSSYISHLPTRLDIYRRLAQAHEISNATNISTELCDRFGPLPESVSNLLSIVEIRAAASEAGVETITWSNDYLIIAMAEPIGGARVALERCLGHTAHVGNQRILVDWSDGWRQELLQLLEQLRDFLAIVTEPR